MPPFICVTCGVQYAPTDAPPVTCPICQDERQYVNWEGQQWTTRELLRQQHHTVIKALEPRLMGIGTSPGFAIGQRALLIQTEDGNVLWDCISLIDDAAVAAVTALGGIRAIAISHPHFYSSMVDWSQAFDAPIYLHADNRPYVMWPHGSIHYWEGETCLLGGQITLVRCGGHFPGSTVLHWPGGAGGQGALLTGDTIQVVQDRRYVSFMYSYPNLIPLSATAVRHLVARVQPYDYDRLYGGWWDKVVMAEAKSTVLRSAERYLLAVEPPDLASR